MIEITCVSGDGKIPVSIDVLTTVTLEGVKYKGSYKVIEAEVLEPYVASSVTEKEIGISYSEDGLEFITGIESEELLSNFYSFGNIEELESSSRNGFLLCFKEHFSDWLTSLIPEDVLAGLPTVEIDFIEGE